MPTHFSHDVLVAAENQARTLLLFGASWCPACQTVKPMLEALARERALELRYYDIDLGDNKTLVEAYGFKTIPAVILLDVNSQEPAYRAAGGLINRPALEARLSP